MKVYRLCDIRSVLFFVEHLVHVQCEAVLLG